MTIHKNTIAVHFSAYAHTNLGEFVCITGNCPQLGMWDPSKGFKLQTNPKQYPIWFSKNPIILQYFVDQSRKLAMIEYKICIMGPDNKILRWQTLKQNRTLSLKTSCSIFLTEDERQAEYQQENQDTVSTKINSTYQGYLSQIEQESQDDEPHHTVSKRVQESSGEDKKRSSSSKRSNSLPEGDQCIHSVQFLRSDSTEYN